MSVTPNRLDGITAHGLDLFQGKRPGRKRFIRSLVDLAENVRFTMATGTRTTPSQHLQGHKRLAPIIPFDGQFISDGLEINRAHNPTITPTVSADNVPTRLAPKTIIASSNFYIDADASGDQLGRAMVTLVSMTGLCGAFALATVALGDARELEPTSPRFHLFAPRPASELRALSTDRPDRTESPFTVDAGHLQIEADLVSAGFDRWNSGGTRDEEWSLLIANFKVGVSPNVDFQLVLPGYSTVRSREEATGATTRRRGFGDVTTRLKVNLWGNDGGETAFAAMPFFKWPTAQNDLGNGAVEGGLILPLAVQLPRDWSLGMMTELDVIRNATDSSYHPEWINSVTMSHPLFGKLSGYAEFFTAVSAEEHSAWMATVDLGLVYGWSDNVQLDAGINIGVTRSAPDFSPFLGFTIRY